MTQCLVERGIYDVGDFIRIYTLRNYNFDTFDFINICASFDSLSNNDDIYSKK